MKLISIALLAALLNTNQAIALGRRHHRDLRDEEMPFSLVAISSDQQSSSTLQLYKFGKDLHQSLLKTKQSLADGDFDKAKRSALQMSKSIKEMVQNLHSADDKQMSPLSTAQRLSYDSSASGQYSTEQKRQCYQQAMHSINQIEQQIQSIMHIIPTISDINKKTGLISSISPVLEKALNELIIQLETTQNQANRFKRGGRTPIIPGSIERELKEHIGSSHDLKEHIGSSVPMRSDGDGGFEADREDDEQDDEDEGSIMPVHVHQRPSHLESSRDERSETSGRSKFTHPQNAKANGRGKRTKITINMDGNRNRNNHNIGNSPMKSNHHDQQEHQNDSDQDNEQEIQNENDQNSNREHDNEMDNENQNEIRTNQRSNKKNQTKKQRGSGALSDFQKKHS